MRPTPPRSRARSSRAPAPQAPRAGDSRRRVLSLLGFAVRSGRLTPGFALTRQGLAAGEVHFVLAADDLAPRRLEALRRVARERGVPVVEGWTRAELGALLGRGATGAAGITDPDLARGMAGAPRPPRRRR
ncbi:MAG TPA: ribosomal L7Ae/L30e/S12e/Gadd45 family protein [Gemmatimonadota bacterium]|jgi:ribosomal protein L7Ae-like RNA K-turn-binding protein